MSRMFLDPQQPLSTCTKKDCAGCDVGGRVNCHFSMKQLVRFLALVMPAMILGITGMFLVFAYPVRFFLLDGTLPLFILAVTLFKVFLGKLYCAVCINFACPFDTVDRKTREEFRQLSTAF